MFDTLFAFLAAGKLGRVQKSAWRGRPHLPLPAASISVALAPIFAQPKSEKRLQRAESPTETLATQATGTPNKVPASRMFIIQQDSQARSSICFLYVFAF